MEEERIELIKELRKILHKFLELGAEVTIQSANKLQEIKGKYVSQCFSLEEKSIITITFSYPKIGEEIFVKQKIRDIVLLPNQLEIGLGTPNYEGEVEERG